MNNGGVTMLGIKLSLELNWPILKYLKPKWY